MSILVLGLDFPFTMRLVFGGFIVGRGLAFRLGLAVGGAAKLSSSSPSGMVGVSGSRSRSLSMSTSLLDRMSKADGLRVAGRRRRRGRRV